MFVLDTNILLYAVNPDSPDHELSVELLENWRHGGTSWFLTWGVIYEFLRVSTHRSVFPKPLSLNTAWQWLGLVLAAPSCGILAETARHWEVLESLVAMQQRLGGNIVHDLHIVALMTEHGIPEIRTADADFHRFRDLTVVNPLES